MNGSHLSVHSTEPFLLERRKKLGLSTGDGNLIWNEFAGRRAHIRCANLFLQPSLAGMAELADAADSKTDLEFTRQIAPGRIYPQIQGITSPRMPVSSVPNRAESR